MSRVIVLVFRVPSRNVYATIRSQETPGERLIFQILSYTFLNTMLTLYTHKRRIISCILSVYTYIHRHSLVGSIIIDLCSFRKRLPIYTGYYTLGTSISRKILSCLRFTMVVLGRYYVVRCMCIMSLSY